MSYIVFLVFFIGGRNLLLASSVKGLSSTLHVPFAFPFTFTVNAWKCSVATLVMLMLFLVVVVVVLLWDALFS